MTTTELDRSVLVRGFELPGGDAWDGRTLDVRIVPYNERATVSDPPTYEPYEEMFMPGVFQRQLTTPGRDKVWLNVEHEQGFRGAVGRSLTFQERDDGLYGSFGVDEGPDGDKALRLVTSGFLTGISVECHALSSRRNGAGVVERHRAHLDKASLCRYPAYASAAVLAMREEHELEPVVVTAPGVELPADVVEAAKHRATRELERNTELDERLAELGFERLDGTMGADELHEATVALTRARPTAARAAEARKLIRYYNLAGQKAPARLRAIAAG